jgi:hypothetical protein
MDNTEVFRVIAEALGLGKSAPARSRPGTGSAAARQ